MGILMQSLGIGLIILGIAFAISVIYVTISREKYLRLQIEFEEAQAARIKAQIEYQEMVNKSAILDGLKSAQEEIEPETIEYQVEQ